MTMASEAAWPDGPDGGHGGHGGPLSGLRVLDMTTSYAGPTASMYLADLGADVIKVERPHSGDDTRAWGPPFVGGTSAWFASANRNKRSIVVDLRSVEGLEVLRALISQADVFMQNLNPAKLERLGMDADTLRQDNPRLIYCAMSGFGLNGPASTLPGYDLAAQARSGLMSVTGAQGGAPQRVSTALSDIVAAMCAGMAICAAALQQQATGVGDVIDVSLLDSDLALMAPRIAAYLAGEPEPAPSGGTDSVLAVYQPFDAADRQVVIAIGNDAMWRRFCEAVGLRDLASDPALRDNAGRRRHRERILPAIAEALKARTAAEWISILAEADVPCSLVHSLSEVVADPHVVARQSVLPVSGAPEGLYSVRAPFRFASMPHPRNEPVPERGADTLAVLRGMGLAEDRIAELVRTDAVEAPSGAAREELRRG